MSQPNHTDVLIIGAGPIGLACAIEAQNRGMSHRVLEKGCIVNSIYNYPTSMRFFSTPDLLEIGGVPFICREEKPTRLDALEYYRRVAESRALNLHLYEPVSRVDGSDGAFTVHTETNAYSCAKVICATGFFDLPRKLNVPGEELDKVTHYYREPHPYAFQKILVVGNGNSATQTALECYRHGADVSMCIRADSFKSGVKYWILPDIENRVKNEEIQAWFKTHLLEIRPQSVVLQTKGGEPFEIANDFVLAMTGYEPNFSFLEQLGIAIGNDKNLTPSHNTSTYETNRPGLFLAGVVCGGMETGRWFIENSRCHADAIFDEVVASGK